MQTAQSPMTGAPKLRPTSGRTPLKPKNLNSPATPMYEPKPKPKQECVMEDFKKENQPVDPLLVEELKAMKKKLERLRLDRERTERVLKERDMVLDDKMKEMQMRGELQMSLEMEADRLFRLKELRSHSMRVSPITTLRDKKQGKIVNEAPSEVNSSTEECETQSPGSASSQVVTERN